MIYANMIECREVGPGFKFTYLTANGGRIDYVLRIMHANPKDFRLPNMFTWVRIRSDGKCEYVGKPDNEVKEWALARISHDPAPEQIIHRLEQAWRQAVEFCREHPATDEYPEGLGILTPLPVEFLDEFKNQTCDEIYQHLSYTEVERAFIVKILRDPTGWEEATEFVYRKAADIIEGMK